MTANSPLTGVKVLDFAWALVGSLTTKLLADHGARVVKVESALRPCLSRIDNQVSASRPGNLDDKPWFSHFNSSKLSLQLNMKHPRMREVIDPLIEWADVIVENFSPGTMEKLGLDYATIRERRPDIIMVSGSVFGQTGPYAKNWGVDGTGAALSGRIYLTGWPDRNPVTPSVPYGDVVLPYYMAATVSAALDTKRRTGAGQYIDASMYEVCVQQMADALTDTQLTGEVPRREGNRSPDVLFQGVFPCRAEGDEQKWIAMSMETEQDWARFVAVLPDEHWPAAEDVPMLSDSELNQLEERIREWTRPQERYALMERLQDSGIAAGVVQDIADTFERDPQLRHRNYLTELDHPHLGRFGHQTPPFKLSRTPAQVRLAPAMGEHNEQVCRDLLGMSAQDYANLKAADVFV
ncbi:CaiB/BaiF CoA transferase family protein [Gilvimarinus sp. F26214L]|uniref:CaiB/BaiF CoA transferase family protein n=1 Tax=Gilvimarinus sp. DZF01 TaxID=3461371 RepID=UPI0040467A56